MSERAAIIQRIDQLVKELQQIGSDQDIRIFYVTATNLLDPIRKKGGRA
jgi:hypothetical protein